MAPRIRQREAVDIPGVSLGRGVQTFVVVSEGAVGDLSLAVGDVLVCRGEARSGDRTVLVAAGLGRPRLGLRQGSRWLGDQGEPCSEERWRSAGRLVARCRRDREGWVADLLDRPSELPAARPVEVFAPAQLSLFAQRTAA
jgi:hypothetical protein